MVCNHMTLILLNICRTKLEEHKRLQNGVIELWDRVEREQNKIDVVVCQNLIESMPRMLAAVVKAKVGYTKYYNL